MDKGKSRESNTGFRLSIVIPHYNSPTKLKRLLLSIPVQDTIQVIVVDDLSTKYLDEYSLLKEEFKDFVNFFDNTIEHKSAGGARNTGLQYVKAHWVMFADADDFFLPGGIETVLRTIEQYDYVDNDQLHTAPTVVASIPDIVYYTVDSCYESDGSQSNRHIPFCDISNRFYDEAKKGSVSRQAELRLRFNWEPPWGKLIRTELIRNNNIEFDEVRYSNDVMFSLRVGFYAKTIDVINECIYCVTQGIGTLTTSIDSRESSIRAAVLADEMNFLFNNLSLLDKIHYFGFAEYAKRACDMDRGIVGKLYHFYAKIRYAEKS